MGVVDTRCFAGARLPPMIHDPGHRNFITIIIIIIIIIIFFFLGRVGIFTCEIKKAMALTKRWKLVVGHWS